MGFPAIATNIRGSRGGLPLRAAVVAAVAIFGLAGAADAKPGHGEPKRHRVDLTGATKKVAGDLPGPIKDQGTVAGKPFRDGRVKLFVALDFPSSTADGTFRIRDDRGTALGTLDLEFVITDGEITFTGTADFTGGKGRYRRIEGEGLKAYDHNTLDGQNGTISLKGFATY